MAALEILQQEVKQFWYTLDDVIIKPRTDLSRPALRYIHIEGVSPALLALNMLADDYPEHCSPWRGDSGFYT
jgi:hypothetical protein